MGLPAPTLVRLAAVAGIDPARAFDEAAIAAGLQARREKARVDASARPEAATTVPGASAETTTPSIGTDPWTPVRDRTPVRIVVDDVVHRFPAGIEAVRGISLTIEPGETVAILGQNGSGKTTLVKHFNGLLRPASGRVFVDGTDAVGRSVAELAATVGFVFQNPDDQLFERSVEREVGFGPRNLGFPTATTAQLVASALSAVGLTDQRATNPYDLDLSRRKLVALAGVLAMDPAVLVLDEPTTGQDAEGVARVGAVVGAVAHAGRSVVAITHDMEFAATHFERIVVLREGQIVADGPPRTVFAAALADLLATTGLTPPPAARIGGRLGLASVPLDAAELVTLLGA